MVCTTTFNSVASLTGCVVRRALQDAPENIATLIRVICSKLFNLITDHTFPSPTNVSVTAFASSLVKSSTGTAERSTNKEVLNCLRVLQRVLPVVFEMEGEAGGLEVEVLWKQAEAAEEPAAPSITATESSTSQFVIEDDDSENGDANEESETKPIPSESASTVPATSAQPKKLLPSLGEKLFGAIIDLLFCCGFTLPTKIQKDHHKVNYVIW